MKFDTQKGLVNTCIIFIAILWIASIGKANSPTNRAFSVAWKQQNMALESTCFADSHVGWTVGDGGAILATRDSGATWQRQSSGTDNNLFDVKFVDARTGWAVGDGGTILVTRDGGATWQPQSSRTQKALYGVYFVNAQTGWAVGVAEGRCWQRAMAANTGKPSRVPRTMISAGCILPMRTPVGRSEMVE